MRCKDNGAPCFGHLCEFRQQRGLRSENVERVGVDDSGHTGGGKQAGEELDCLRLLAHAGADSQNCFSGCEGCQLLWAEDSCCLRFVRMRWRHSGHVINSGAIVATSGKAGAGTAAVTRPAPERKAANADIEGAPDLPPAVPNVPPTTSTWPKFPLLLSTARGACARASAEPAQYICNDETMAASGEPIGATTMGWFQCRVSWPKTCAGLGAVKVMTASTGETGPGTIALVSSAGQPEGRSMASTGAELARIHSSAARARPFNGGLKPVPRTHPQADRYWSVPVWRARSSGVLIT